MQAKTGESQLVDYHIHTPLCRHAIGQPIEYAKVAQRLGFAEIGFADHNPMPDYFDDWRMPIDELPRYFEQVDEARSVGIPIKVGLECDYLEKGESWIETLSSKADWDYLIGSVHYLAPGWDVDNPKHISRFQELPVEEIWDRYWELYIRCIRSKLFDFVAHPDLPKKFGHRPNGDLRRYYEHAIQALKDAGIAYELNTAGWRKQVDEQYPSFEFLNLASQEQIPLLINSDAHAPEEIGFRFSEARKLAKEAGYTNLVRFEKRKKIWVELV
jgi:histidinol-phosphatase (PHP family)